jgi:hydroxymethylpyrimidine pyrophosphatase-like HAD family hydrolase
MIKAMKNKAIIFDIDGTAIDSPSQKIPSDRLIKAVRQIETEYFVCAATGRVWSFAEPVIRGLNKRLIADRSLHYFGRNPNL